jgi:hypothetical protein
MAVTIDEVSATVEGEEHPAPPSSGSPGAGENHFWPVNATRSNIALLAQREARLSAD